MNKGSIYFPIGEAWQSLCTPQRSQKNTISISIASRWVLLNLFISSMFACHDQPIDKMGHLIEALKSKDWEMAQGYMSQDLEWASFPLYQALKSGDQWLRLARVRQLDHHVLFEIDLKYNPSSMTSGQVSRHLFWTTISSENQNTQTKFTQIDEIIGWSPPKEVSFVTREEVSWGDLSSPSRFSATSYRQLVTHQQEASLARHSLGVIGLEGSGAIEPGWYARLEVEKANLASTDHKHSKRCLQIKQRWSKRLQVLSRHLNTHCEPPLLLAAQNSRYMVLTTLRDKVDVSQGRGGSLIRKRQDQELLESFINADQVTTMKKNVHKSNTISLNNNLSFNGSLILSQNLNFPPEQRSLPVVSEAMITSTPVTQCVMGVMERWSSDFLKQAPCRYDISIRLEVNEIGRVER